MEAVTPTIRQFLGCGYLPRIEKAQPWRPLGLEGDVTTCAGYLEQLPSVGEVARAYLHWDRGQLQLRDDDPPSALMDGIEVLAGSISSCQAHGIKERSRG